MRRWEILSVVIPAFLGMASAFENSAVQNSYGHIKNIEIKKGTSFAAKIPIRNRNISAPNAYDKTAHLVLFLFLFSFAKVQHFIDFCKRAT